MREANGDAKSKVGHPVSENPPVSVDLWLLGKKTVSILGFIVCFVVSRKPRCRRRRCCDNVNRPGGRGVEGKMLVVPGNER